jgi:hypothetical protein
MVGEERHALLAWEGFKRVNAQYDLPRHSTTAYVQHKDPKRDPLLNSPYWSGLTPDSATTTFDTNPVTNRDPSSETLNKMEKRERDSLKASLKAKLPQKFFGFDKFVVNISVRLACQLYIGWPPSVKITEEASHDVIMTTHDVRFCYLTEDGDKKEEREEIDWDSIKAMRNKLHGLDSLQLSQKLFNKYYIIPYRVDWEKIKN